jgi:heterodisulfide reductase subunit A-like polyferredoxin
MRGDTYVDIPPTGRVSDTFYRRGCKQHETLQLNKNGELARIFHDRNIHKRFTTYSMFSVYVEMPPAGRVSDAFYRRGCKQHKALKLNKNSKLAGIFHDRKYHKGFATHTMFSINILNRV